MTAHMIQLLAAILFAGLLLGTVADMAFVLIRNRVKIIHALRADRELDQ
jgi:hypothetical protein